jgi:hypothetical protein
VGSIPSFAWPAFIDHNHRGVGRDVAPAGFDS